MWNVPTLPNGFPDSADRLDLSFEEASWVRERMLSGSPGSLLEVLLNSNEEALRQLPAAWDVPVESIDLAALIEHARLFSLVVQGAGLSYNLALANRYEAMSLTQVEQPVARYREEIDAWMQLLDDDRDALRTWDLGDLWARALAHNPRISWATQDFINTWVDVLVRGAGPQEQIALDVVMKREKRQKGTQSRLVNDKLLRSWTGASGTARLSYRWANVTRLLTDVSAGLQHASA